MIVEIALGIILAVLLVAVGIAVLAILIKFLPEIFTYVVGVGSLLLLIHFLGGWGLALWFALIIGFLCFAGREAIFNQSSGEKIVSETAAQDRRGDEEAEKQARRAKEQVEWEARRRRQKENWRAEAQAQEDQKKKEREARHAAYAAKKEAERQMCVKALKEGRNVLGIDGTRPCGRI